MNWLRTLSMKTIMNDSLKTANEQVSILAFYKFAHLDNLQTMRIELHRLCEDRSIRGTILLADEGINGTVAGSSLAINELIAEFDSEPRLRGMERKISLASTVPFHRLKVKIKKEIVTMGVPGVDVASHTGVRLGAKEWNQLLQDPDVTLLDTRNQYEVDIGTFKKAVSPHTQTFREFPEYVEKHLSGSKNKKIAMFCTGGIRCEKASSYLLERGYTEVYQLDGGDFTLPGECS